MTKYLFLPHTNTYYLLLKTYRLCSGTQRDVSSVRKPVSHGGVTCFVHYQALICLKQLTNHCSSDVLQQLCYESIIRIHPTHALPRHTAQPRYTHTKGRLTHASKPARHTARPSLRVRKFPAVWPATASSIWTRTGVFVQSRTDRDQWNTAATQQQNAWDVLEAAAAASSENTKTCLSHHAERMHVRSLSSLFRG